MRDVVFSRLLRGGRTTKWKGEAASYAPAVQLVSATAPVLRNVLLPAALLVGLGASPAAAADRYWDVNNTSLGRGGTGTWNLTSPVWSASNDGTSGPYSAWNNGALDDAFFGGTAGTVTLGGAIFLFATVNYLPVRQRMVRTVLEVVGRSVKYRRDYAAMQGPCGARQGEVTHCYS